jgi:hypothetical protein
LAHSSSEWIVITAHDLIVATDTFSVMLETGAEHLEFGILGPHYADEPDSGDGVLDEHDGILRRKWICGACMLVRRRCAEETGPFDEDYSSWWEDIDYGFRARQAGWQLGQVLAASATTLGHAGGTRGEIQRHSNRLLFAAKHGGMRALPRASWVLTKQAAWSARQGKGRGAFENLAAIPRGLSRAARLGRHPPGWGGLRH